MNIKYMPLLLMVLFSTIQGMQQEKKVIRTGNITINNTLAQPISYTFSTMPEGETPGFKAAPGSTTLNGKGEIPAQESKLIPAARAQLGYIWGDTITFTLGRNEAEALSKKYSFPITELGDYTIGTEGDALTLKKSSATPSK